ncbi:phage tail-collar fiber domain-containing protein [Marinomonas sp. PE14-40]|uniref:phage tail-collar fiber domain-containing protein n=1 Tax=Marinomonas sp. PE14-40 TaxID=3060621 RepID=UPI003F67D759
MAFITIEGENQIAKKQGENSTLNITKFVLAYIDGLAGEPSTRIESVPTAEYVVDQLDITKAGYVNTNQVVYSLVMGANLGDYDFNWVGLVDDEGVLIATSYIPTIPKRKNNGPVAGNTLTRNFLLAYTGIQQTSAITVPAETWQLDFTDRLFGIDERARKANLDIYGNQAFLDDGFKVSGAAGTYGVAAGVGYVGGVRIENTVSQELTTSIFPNEIWLNVSLQGDISDFSAVNEFVIDVGPFADYIDANNVTHYLAKIADIDAGGNITDTRPIGFKEDIKQYIDKRVNSKNILESSGSENDLVLTSKEGVSLIYELRDHYEFSFIVSATNTAPVTLKIDDLSAISIVNISSGNQLIKSALATVMYIDKAFYLIRQINPKTGSSVLDIAKLYTDTVDILRPGEYALDGAALSRAAHPIAFAIVSASSNYIDQATKDASPIEYGGFYGDGDGSTTFTLPIVGGEFIRMFDDGRGIDNGRGFGSYQEDAIRNLEGVINANYAVFNEGLSGVFKEAGLDNDFSITTSGTALTSNGRVNFDASLVVPTADENRPRSIAYYGKTRL